MVEKAGSDWWGEYLENQVLCSRERGVERVSVTVFTYLTVPGLVLASFFLVSRLMTAQKLPGREVLSQARLALVLGRRSQPGRDSSPTTPTDLAWQAGRRSSRRSRR